MPTTRPRYTFTDTGHLRDLLDAAAGRWPEVADRKELLLKLAEEGHGAIEAREGALAAEEYHAQALAALDRIRSLVDPGVLLSDQAWA